MFPQICMQCIASVILMYTSQPLVIVWALTIWMTVGGYMVTF